MKDQNDSDTHKRILNVERYTSGPIQKHTVPANTECLSNSHIHDKSEAWRVNADNWLTTNRAVHNEKIQEPLFHQPVIRMAPSLTKIDFILPEKVSTSSNLQLRHLQDSRERLTTTMKADYVNWNDQPIKEIIDTMQGYRTPNLTPAKSIVGEGFRGCILKPYYAAGPMYASGHGLDSERSMSTFSYWV